MKMTDALFWQRRRKSDDPFLEAQLPAAFYHPSLPRPLKNVGESEIKLSPQKLTPPSGEKEDAGSPQLTPQEKAFMGRSNTVLTREMPTRDTPSPPDTSSKFNESWPSSERPSTLAESPADGAGSAACRERGLTPSSRAAGNIGTTEGSFDFSSLLQKQEGTGSLKQAPGSVGRHPDPKKDSVLARYIHRFRNAAPQSRRERASPGLARDLWWMSPPTRDTPSTSSADAHPRIRPHSRMSRAGSKAGQGPSSSSLRSSSRVHSDVPAPSSRRAPGRVPLAGALGLRDHVTSSEDGTDLETTSLQEKARHLLELSESSLLSEPAVSSEGVGTSSPSLPSSDNRVYVPPEISPIREEGHGPYLTRGPGHPGSSGASRPQRPEDDILYRWRLRRKMELAQKPAELSKHKPNSSSEAFWSRVNQDGSPSKTAPTRSERDHIQLVKTTGTDPIPQVASTQTRPVTRNAQQDQQAEIDVDFGPKGSLRIGGQKLSAETGRAGVGGFEQTSRDCDRLDAQELGSRGGHSRGATSGGEERPITRPVIGGSKRPVSKVPPHRHMSCDIIPCPHGDRPHDHDEDTPRARLLYDAGGETADDGTKDDRGGECATNGRGYSDRRSEDSHWEDGRRCRREDREEQGELRVLPRSSVPMDERGKSSANKRIGYPGRKNGVIHSNVREQRSTEERFEEVERSRSRPRDERGGYNDEIDGKDGIRCRRPSKTEQGLDDDDDDGNVRTGIGGGRAKIGGTDSQRGNPVSPQKRTEAEYDDIGGSRGGQNEDHVRTGGRGVTLEGDGTSTAAPPRNAFFGWTKRTEAEHRVGSSLQTEDTERGEVSLAGSSDTEPFTDVSSEGVEALSAPRQPPVGPQEVVRSAVSEVVSKTVFSPGSLGPSTVTAPPSRALTAGVPQGPDSAHTSNLPPPGGGGGSQSASSDGEEFADDELLQMLRRKRALYENQLQQIDDLISEKQRL